MPPFPASVIAASRFQHQFLPLVEFYFAFGILRFIITVIKSILHHFCIHFSVFNVREGILTLDPTLRRRKLTGKMQKGSAFPYHHFENSLTYSLTQNVCLKYVFLDKITETRIYCGFREYMIQASTKPFDEVNLNWLG